MSEIECAQLHYELLGRRHNTLQSHSLFALAKHLLVTDFYKLIVIEGFSLNSFLFKTTISDTMLWELLVNQYAMLVVDLGPLKYYVTLRGWEVGMGLLYYVI